MSQRSAAEHPRFFRRHVVDQDRPMVDAIPYGRVLGRTALDNYRLMVENLSAAGADAGPG